MLIRAEQMTVFEATAEENFVRRIAAHLLERYAKTIVRLPQDKQSPVDELTEEDLHSLVRNSIEQARSYGLDSESSISAFSAVRFEVSPNFDKHRLCQVLLKDENTEPNARLDELLEVLSEKNWETIRDDYDVNAWQSKAEESENPEDTEKSDDAKNLDFAETVMNVGNVENSKKPDVPPVPDFDLTVMNADTTEKPNIPAARQSPDFDKTMFNFDNTMINFASSKKPEKSGND